MIVTGAEWNKFYNDSSFWKPDFWVDDLLIVVNGEELDDNVETVDPKAKVKIESGVVYFDEDGHQSVSLSTFLKRWRKSLLLKTVVVDVPLEMLEEVTTYLKLKGCKVSG